MDNFVLCKVGQTVNFRDTGNTCNDSITYLDFLVDLCSLFVCVELAGVAVIESAVAFFPTSVTTKKVVIAW